MSETTVLTKCISRKKTVPGKYQPNTYRVISTQAEEFRRRRPSSSHSSPPTNNIGQRLDQTQVNLDYRRHRPNAINVGFIVENAATYNEPVPAVVTATGRLQRSWWPTDATDVPPRAAAPYTVNTTARESYQYHGGDGGMRGYTRHSYNPHKLPLLGIVPVNLLRRSDGKQRFWKEGFSMEQHVDCRRTPSYPIRGKRQGAFVWKEIPPVKVDRLLHSMNFVADKELQTDAESIQTQLSASTKPPSSVTSARPLHLSDAHEAKVRAKSGMPVIV